MKKRNILFCIAVIVFLTSQLPAQNTNPVVTNVAFGIVGTTVTVTYDVTDGEQSTVTVHMKVSNDGGVTWGYDYGVATGDIGANVTTGTGKTITWTYNGPQSNNFQVMIYANDNVAGGSPCPGVATVDYSGKTYNTILIGSQCWLKENLDVGTYVASTYTGSTHSDVSNNGIIEKYCYGNNELNCATYGGLYDWKEAMGYVTTPGTQGICPPGWHIPTLAEFETLKGAVNDDGNTLKSIGQGTGSGAGTNTSGFSGLLGGYRNDQGSFYNLGSYAYFWSSTEYNSSNAYYQNLEYLNTNINLVYYYKEDGFSVRCLKNN